MESFLEKEIDINIQKQFYNSCNIELYNNKNKGVWKDWQPSLNEVNKEIIYHYNKLNKAMEIHDKNKIEEYCCDIVNLCFKLYEVNKKGER